MKKRCFSTELAWLLGLAVLAVGTALMERADFGVSMVVAPAYLIYRKLSAVLPFFTFGMAEYCLQAVLLAALFVVLGRFRLAELFSFVTALCYGVLLDGAMAALRLVPGDALWFRLVCYLAGMGFCALGVSLLFQTYIAPEVYELFVKRMAQKLQKPIPRVKTCYDCTSCAVAIVLSFCFFGFGHFVGVQLGTVFCALVNGWLIGRCSTLLERHWIFVNRWPLRSFFERDVQPAK